MNFHGLPWRSLFRIAGCFLWRPTHTSRHRQLQCLFNTSPFRSACTKTSADGAPPSRCAKTTKHCAFTISQAPSHFSIHSAMIHPPSVAFLIASARSCFATHVSQKIGAMCSIAQPAHQRRLPSTSSPKDGCLLWHTSHLLVTTSAAPGCAFAQPAHQRALPSAGSSKDGTLLRHTSHFLVTTFAAPGCAFAQPAH
jgi:hypothetical protein